MDQTKMETTEGDQIDLGLKSFGELNPRRKVMAIALVIMLSCALFFYLGYELGIRVASEHLNKEMDRIAKNCLIWNETKAYFPSPAEQAITKLARVT